MVLDGETQILNDALAGYKLAPILIPRRASPHSPTAHRSPPSLASVEILSVFVLVQDQCCESPGESARSDIQVLWAKRPIP